MYDSIEELADKYDFDPLLLRAWAWEQIYYIKYWNDEFNSSGST